MGRNRPKKVHKNNKAFRREWKTCNYQKDVDQIYDELNRDEKKPLIVDENNSETPAKVEPDADLPGLGFFYCVPCSRHFQSATALVGHKASKPHKKRLKILKERPFDPEIDPC